MKGPSVASIKKYLRVEPDEAREIKRLMDGAQGGRSVEDAMLAIDKILGTYGTEAITAENSAHSGYFYDAVALYVNTGDTYNPTILYDVNKRRFELTTWGDWVENNDRKYGIR